jgi:hypothetical protein
MRRFFFLSCWIVLLAGCAVPSITVVVKKEPTKPFSKVLTIYMDEACDFTMFDSTTYNICVKSCFMKTDNFGVRTKVEKMLVEELSSSGTAIIKSSALFGTRDVNYNDFIRSIDSLGIDAILLVDYQKYLHDLHIGAPIRAGNGIQYSSGVAPGYNGNGIEHQVLDAGFQCYLISPRNMLAPLWIAQLGARGNHYTGKKGPDQSIAQKIAKSLKGMGYIAH